MNLSIFEKAGIEVTEQGTVSEVFKQSGLDWEVRQKPVYSLGDTYSIDPKYDRIPNLIANYRSDTDKYLGVVHPKTYKVVQNVEAFNFIDELPNFTFERVGEFNSGKKVFVVGKADDQITLDNGDDPIDMYLTFILGHSGTTGIRMFVSPIRLFCMNQMNLLLETAQFKFSIQHTGDIQFKLDQIKKHIAKAHKYTAELELAIKDSISTKSTMSIENFTSLLIKDEDNDSKLIHSRKEDMREQIINLYNKDDIANYKGTNFGILSAVSDYVSHINPLRNKTNQDTINTMFIKNLENNTLLNDAYMILKAA